MTPQLNPQTHLQWFKDKISKIDQVVLFLILMLSTIFYSGIHLSASTNQIQVNNTGDQALAGGASVCDTDLTDGATVTCTLRAAIEFANANANNGTIDEIIFTGLTGADIVITIGSDLPTITEQIYIDGTDGDGHIRDITIEGGGTANVDGFLFEGNNSHGSKLENLVVRGFKDYNLKINNSVRTAATTYLIQNNYFGVDQDGSTVYTGTSNYNVYFQSSDHINFNSNTAAGKRWYHLYASSSDNVNIQNSNLGATSSGAKVVDNSNNMVVSGYGVYALNSDHVTIDDNVIGGMEGSYAIEVQTGDNFTITDNRVCISATNVNLCKDGYGIQIDGLHDNYSTAGTITGNTIDGKDATNGNLISGLTYGVGLQFVDNLTFSNNRIGMTNGFSVSGSSILKMNEVYSSTFSKGANGAFGTSDYGIYFSGGDIYNNTFQNFDITWTAGTPSGETDNLSGFRWDSAKAYNNTFTNIKISGVDNAMYNLDGAAEEFNYFDGVSAFSLTNARFSSQDPFTTAQNALQSGTPTVNSTTYSGGSFRVNLDVSATVTGQSCTFSAYISDVTGEADIFLQDGSGNRQVSGTLNAGTCSLTGQEFIVPATYTVQNNNFLNTMVTDVIASANLDDGTAVSNVKQTSAYSTAAAANFNLPVTAAITINDGDSNHAESMFPKNTTVTLDASTSTNGASYAWDLNNSKDAADDGNAATSWDDDGNPSNDIDATGTSVTVNYVTNQVNGSNHYYALTGNSNFLIKLVATGIMSDTNSTTKNIKLLDPSITGGIESCIADPGGGYKPNLIDMSSVTPASLYWDFDTLTDAADDGDAATSWDGDGTANNDQQATSATPVEGPTYAVGNYILSLNHVDTSGEQIVTTTKPIEVVSSIASPSANFSHSVSNLTASFTDSSTGGCITAYEWDFDNNGVVDSTAENPSHTYGSPGTYNATLKVTNQSGNNTISPVAINVTNVAPQANFNASSLSVTPGTTVNFTDTSTGDFISAYAWDFNEDNNADSTAQNPSHTFNTVGTFDVKLTVTNPAGSHSKTVAVNVLPNSAFSINDGSGNAALEIDGTGDPALPNVGLIVPQNQVVTLSVLNQVAGVTYTWDLSDQVDSNPDGNNSNDTDATGTSVTINYKTGAVNGVVNDKLDELSANHGIKLTATKESATSNLSATIQLMVASATVVDCQAKDVAITGANNSTGFNSSSWNFGDGSNPTTYQNNSSLSANHTYTSAGNYNVVLSIFDDALAAGQAATVSNAIVIEESVVTPVASATYTKFVPDPADDFHAQFTNASTGGCLSYEWDFNDDGITDSTLTNPTYDFNALGTYPVALKATNSAGTHTYTFDVVITDAGPTAGFTPSVTSGQAPLTVTFTNTTTGTGFTSQWDFETDGNTDSILNNTQKEFTTPGVYRVTLSVTNYEGNSTTFKDITVHPKSTFTFSPNSGNTNTDFIFTADFQDETNYDYAWDIDNDGSNDGVVAVFTDKYSSSGTKTAKLTVTSKANPALTSFTTSSAIEVAQVSSGSSSSSNNYSAPVKSSSNDQSSDSSQSENDSESSNEDSSQDQSESDNTPASEPDAESDETLVFESEVIAPIVIPVSPVFEPVIDTPFPAEESLEPEAADEDAPETDETDEADEADEPEVPAEEQTEEPEGLFDNLAELLTGALVVQAPDSNEVQAPVVQTEAVKVEDKQVEQELTQVFATKSEEVLTNQEKQTQVLAQADVSEKKKTIASKVVVDTAKQKEIVERVVEKVRLKQAQEQEEVQTIQAQDEDNNGVSDAIQELIGLSNEEIEEQQQEDPNLLAPRAIFLNPNNATADIMLEMRESETYPDDKFIANGIVDTPQAQAGDIVAFYAQKDGEKLLIGSSPLDANKNFSYVNRSELEPGQYDIVAKLQSDGSAATEFSVPVEVTIDPQAEQIPVTLDGFSGQTSDTLQARTNTAFANTHDVISGVVLQPNEPVSLALKVDSELARVVVNFNSVLYSATAITSSTNSQIEVDAPLELSFQPGTSHTATAFAESIEDPNIKSKPIIIEFSIANQTPWYLSMYALILYGILLVGVSSYCYHSRGLSA